MGRVTAEAMALGLPVIGYNSSGTAELIEDEVTGLLFDGRPEHLAQQMGRILHEKGLAERLRLAAWQQASRHFTIERYCDTIWSICRTSLEQWRG
jgi:glycosyltransferase involved in cell wall biosynthesis